MCIKISITQDYQKSVSTKIDFLMLYLFRTLAIIAFQGFHLCEFLCILEDILAILELFPFSFYMGWISIFILLNKFLPKAKEPYYLTHRMGRKRGGHIRFSMIFVRKVFLSYTLHNKTCRYESEIKTGNVALCAQAPCIASGSQNKSPEI